ncbi:hypothetical protein [Streptomyces werraensis]|uniref:hypothetical protein n=1 Tax=Streptomyces werraensis TaxID=68284 RepID=UPI0037D08BE0
MTHVLEALLPHGKISRTPGSRARRGEAPSAEVVFGDGARAVNVKVHLNWYPLPVPAQVSECPDTAYHPYSRCTTVKLPDGARLVLDRSPRSEDTPDGPRQYTALVTYKDGRQVAVSETGDSEGRSATSDAPLSLSVKRLSAVATSAAWRPALAALPAPRASGAPVDSVSRMTGAHISGLAARLLPDGLRVSRKGGQSGFGHLVADDGHGGSLIAVNVQRWRADNPSMTSLFVDAETLPDGTRVTLTKAASQHGGKGAVQWTADTLRPDGLRVVISAVNAPAYLLPASRSTPVLTMRQLRDMALDPAWQKAGD